MQIPTSRELAAASQWLSVMGYGRTVPPQVETLKNLVSAFSAAIAALDEAHYFIDASEHELKEAGITRDNALRKARELRAPFEPHVRENPALAAVFMQHPAENTDPSKRPGFGISQMQVPVGGGATLTIKPVNPNEFLQDLQVSFSGKGITRTKLFNAMVDSGMASKIRGTKILHTHTGEIANAVLQDFFELLKVPE